MEIRSNGTEEDIFRQNRRNMSQGMGERKELGRRLHVRAYRTIILLLRFIFHQGVAFVFVIGVLSESCKA